MTAVISSVPLKRGTSNWASRSCAERVYEMFRKMTPEQAEAYKHGTPAARRATRGYADCASRRLASCRGTALLLALDFHKTGHGGGPY